MRTIVSIILLIVISGCKDNYKIKNNNIENISVNSKDEIECDLLPDIRTKSSVSFFLKEITESKYLEQKTDKADELLLFSNSDSIENILQNSYPKVFKKNDDKYKLKAYNGDEIIVFNNLVQEKTYSKYEFKGSYKNYIFLVQEFYEGGNVIVVDVTTNKSYIISSKPYFITDKLFYSYTFDYGAGVLDINDIEKEEYFSLSFENVSIEESYNISNHIRLKVKCLNSQENRFLEVLKW